MLYKHLSSNDIYYFWKEYTIQKQYKIAKLKLKWSPEKVANISFKMTITLDNGTEFANHQEITQNIACPIYFVIDQKKF